MAVSYTHLDVYKRQIIYSTVYRNSICIQSYILSNEVNRKLNILNTVSYTHLDVYKRQEEKKIHKIVSDAVEMGKMLNEQKFGIRMESKYDTITRHF